MGTACPHGPMPKLGQQCASLSCALRDELAIQPLTAATHGTGQPVPESFLSQEHPFRFCTAPPRARKSRARGLVSGNNGRRVAQLVLLYLCSNGPASWRLARAAPAPQLI